MNDEYDVRIEERVLKELRAIAPTERQRITAAILTLRKNPRPGNAVRLVGQPGWRIRIGNYRVLYEIDDAARKVTIYRAGHRSDVYKMRE
ncbi:MAG: type II toxin-antitoxin system RelE/ParE family toxin [Candidatus Hydrogenedentes bacterium]|nr:type II toxin-antitoxin system RelE/ParE family toxin [Candidatus Hydrogenedentota bacterium]